ncbi:MAG: uroporphyrinogen-III synthase [Chitinophagales bacterium]|nr:uroporphyrinogen-III synthase [Bacteroidota bacterium]
MAKNVKTKITTDKKLAASKGTKTSTPKKIEIANTKSKSSTTTKVKKDSLPNPKSKKSKKEITETKQIPTIVVPDKLKPVKSILISQPQPESGKSPYIDLAQFFKIKLDWRPFTHIEAVSSNDFRKEKIYLEQYACIIFTSRVGIEHYFRICEEMRVKINEDNKYFCISEAIALYLQKFINYRKRKVFYGDGKLPKLIDVILKHKDAGKFLLPCSNVRDAALADKLQEHQIEYSEAVIYKTVASDLSDLSDVKYDMLVFFNPSAIDSLYTNFPKFTQDETRLAIFGNSTAETVNAHKLNINVFAPTPENPSLVDAIKKYITAANKKR